MPTWEIEDKAGNAVCGVDEAGRGPWVGPVVAGAVMFLSRDVNPEILAHIDDSKKLTAKKREKLYDLLLTEARAGRLTYGIGEASAAEIDALNILQATFLAMQRSVAKLNPQPVHALIDGNRLPTDFVCATSCYVGGDARSYSIAAASVLAKVYRDNLMKELAQKYPYYGFEKNAGYGTKDHIEGLKKYGITPEHRKSYKPIKDLLEQAI
ncbi:MAG: ribonuclease HII [Alphaproteobacteria bacterium]|nr:ribonuclease HII [Alphaproteobacteria bacterium]